MWQISFAAKPQVLEELQQQLKLDERILRHIFVKKDVFKPLPTTSTVKKQASQLLKGQPPVTSRVGRSSLCWLVTHHC